MLWNKEYDMSAASAALSLTVPILNACNENKETSTLS